MSKLVKAVTALVLLAATAGCWSRFELVEYGFVQAAAIDLSSDGRLKLTAQIYKPGGSGGSATGPSSSTVSSYLNLDSQSRTLAGVSTDTALQLGRRLQWSHMRMLLLSEEAVRSRDIGMLLDFFMRFYESRGTMSVLITEGQAAGFLQIKPLIESTMGQQLKHVEESGSRLTGKTLNVSLTDLVVQSMEEQNLSILPYASIRRKPQELAVIDRLALIRFPSGRLTGIVSADRTPYLLMLVNRFKQGVLEVPCGRPARTFNSFVIHDIQTKIKPSVGKDGALQLSIVSRLKGVTGELNCADVTTAEGTEAFRQEVAGTVENGMRDTLRSLQGQKADAIGASMRIYRFHKHQWLSIKERWPETFASGTVKIDVEVMLVGTGRVMGTPLSEKG